VTIPDVVIPTGSANLASVMAAFRRLDVTLVTTESFEVVAAASRVVLPGVGTFGAAVNRLQEIGVVGALRNRVREGKPTLAVCVGMQLLAASSDESPGSTGLGLVDAAITRFDNDLIVPQLAWSQVMPEPGSRFVEPGWAYFANSYRLPEPPRDWVGSSAVYGKPFVAAIERGDVLACQFHPELSGAWGASLLQRWIEATGGAK
jgi:glutamine amidotransferase